MLLAPTRGGNILGKWSEEAKRRHSDRMKQTLTSSARVPFRGSSRCASLV